MAKKKLSQVVNISEIVREYRELTERENQIKARKTELANMIKEHAQQHGAKDDKGSFYMRDDRFVFGSQARKSVKLNEEKAREFFVKRELWEQVRKIEEKIDEEKVEELLVNGTITMEELESITDIKLTYAVDVRPVEQEQKPEDMPEIKPVSNSLKAPSRTRR